MLPVWSRGKHSLLCLSFSPNFWAKVKPAALKVLVSKHDHIEKQHVNYAENAAEVGGRASIGCPYLTNNSRRQLSKQLLVQSYINTTKRSIVGIGSITSCSVGIELNLLSTSVISSKLSQVIHAVALPQLAKKDNWSQPVNAWKKEDQLPCRCLCKQKWCALDKTTASDQSQSPNITPELPNQGTTQLR